MPTPRFPPAPLAEPVQQRLARLLPPGMPAPQLFAAVARNEGLFCQLVDSGLLGPTGLLDRRALPSRQREALILRTCVATGNDYEFNLHVQTISERMGLTEAQIEDLRHPRPSDELWSPAERVVFDLVDALVARVEVDDALFARLREHHDEATLVELVQLVGLYHGVAMMTALVRPGFDLYRWPQPRRARAAAA